jgi:hypothetical protein
MAAVTVAVMAAVTAAVTVVVTVVVMAAVTVAVMAGGKAITSSLLGGLNTKPACARRIAC